MSCPRCEEQAQRQAEQMAPREHTVGIARVNNLDALAWVIDGKHVTPDIRLGDFVRIELVAGAVEDMGWCPECHDLSP